MTETVSWKKGRDEVQASYEDPFPVTQANHYETVAAGSTDQAMGAPGGTGDFLTGVLVVPATTGAGAVKIKDGAGSAITIFAGGPPDVKSFYIPIGARSVSGAWSLSAAASVSLIGFGFFKTT